jgi:hypothetical protein
MTTICLMAYISALAAVNVASMGLLDWAIRRRPNYVRHARY